MNTHIPFFPWGPQLEKYILKSAYIEILKHWNYMFLYKVCRLFAVRWLWSRAILLISQCESVRCARGSGRLRDWLYLFFCVYHSVAFVKKKKNIHFIKGYIDLLSHIFVYRIYNCLINYFAFIHVNLLLRPPLPPSCVLLFVSHLSQHNTFVVLLLWCLTAEFVGNMK